MKLMILFVALLVLVLGVAGCTSPLSKDCKGDKKCILQSNMCQKLTIKKEGALINQTVSILGKGESEDLCKVKLSIESGGKTIEKTCSLQLPIKSGSADEIISRLRC